MNKCSRYESVLSKFINYQIYMCEGIKLNEMKALTTVGTFVGPRQSKILCYMNRWEPNWPIEMKIFFLNYILVFS